MLRHLDGIGLFILAALDSSVLPTLGGVDALTIVLASLHPRNSARMPQLTTVALKPSLVIEQATFPYSFRSSELSQPI